MIAFRSMLLLRPSCLLLIWTLLAPLAPATEPAASMQPLPLDAVANRGFRDEVGGDGRGGWTDQGPDNDLSTFRPGRFTRSQVTFEVLNPAQHDNRAVLVLGRASQKVARDPGEAVRAPESHESAAPESPMIATQPLPGVVLRNLYLLHASASPPRPPQTVGYLVAQYTDGSTTRHEVRNGRDIGNWRDPAPAENAEIAWESENPTASIGLYLSGFAVEPKPLASVTFELAGEAPWMIVALSGSTEDIRVGTIAQPLTIEPGPDWGAYRHSLDVAPGGVFDFSSLLHAPAGQFGPIRATPVGHFEFTGRPGVRVRFWGVNLCFSAQFLEKDEADQLAERLARSGYNTVRFHHFDAELVRGQSRSWELNPEALDQLDYLFAALKRRGLYINIDLFSSRPFSADEYDRFGLPPGRGRTAFKSLLPISEAAFESWARFATNLLGHRNPYTGLTWAEDPALIGICPVNENPLFNRIEQDPAIFALYQRAFESAGGEGPPVTTNPAFNQFIHETNWRSDERMFAHLRSLGTHALLTGANYTISQGLAYVRENYDYVDCHSYWDHPKFPERAWALPIAFGQGSAVRARAKMPNRIMPTRIFGRPFVSTEFNFCRPNRHRFEGAVLMPAYASLQDWDGLYNFQYAMSRQMAVHSGVENYFAIANDPIGLLADRIGAFLFQRGDIAPAQNAIVYAVQPDEAFSALGRLFPGDFSPLGLVTRIGSLTGLPAEVQAKANPAHPISAIISGSVPPGSPARTYAIHPELSATLQREGVLPAGSVSSDQTHYTSDTGQIALSSETGAVKVVTPSSELFLLPPQAQLSGDRVSVTNGDARGAVLVIALEAAGNQVSFAAARRLLITHLTDALPSGMTFTHPDRKRLTSWGEGPHLVARGEATLDLKLPDGPWRAWAVDATGARTHEVPLSPNDGSYRLHLSTITPEGTQLAYELAR